MLKVDQSPSEKKFVQNPYVFYRKILKEGGRLKLRIGTMIFW